MTDHVSVRHDGGDLDPEQPQAAAKTHLASPSYPRLASVRRSIPRNISREEAVLRLETFYRLTRLLADCENDVDRIAAAAARLASEALGDMATIALLNAHGETYHIAAYHDPDPQVMELFTKYLAATEQSSISSEQGSVALVIRTGKPLLIPTTAMEELAPMAVPAFAEFGQRAGVASLLIVPITGASGTLGTIAMARHSGGRPYTEHNRDFLMEIGFRVGLAIESATLVESLRNEVVTRLFAKEALAASEQRFLSIFHSTTFGIKIMDLVGTILETNSAFQVMIGYGETELIAMHFYDLIHPDDVAPVLNAFMQLKSGREIQKMIEHRLCRKDGSIVWVRTTFAGVRKSATNPTLSLIFGIVEDISERRQSDAELKELRQHLQRSIEIERLRLAQNLHDTPLQELYAVIYKLEELRPSTRPATSEIIGDVIGDIKKTLDGLRATASELRPPALSRFGLEKAIRSHVEDYRVKHPDMTIELALAQDHQLLPEDIRMVLFRVFQEAMANIARHAKASEVKVRFSFDAEEARLEVSDNGRGFEVPDNWMASARGGHYGLAGMVERVSAAGGVLELESRPAGPTTVRVVIPC
jgi:PAS domain S-box-containing protein